MRGSSGYRVWGLGFGWVWGVGFGALGDFGFRVSGFRALGSGFRA